MNFQSTSLIILDADSNDMTSVVISVRKSTS